MSYILQINELILSFKNAFCKVAILKKVAKELTLLFKQPSIG